MADLTMDGKAGLTRHGTAWPGMAWRGEADGAWRGRARPGKA